MVSTDDLIDFFVGDCLEHFEEKNIRISAKNQLDFQKHIKIVVQKYFQDNSETHKK